MLAFRLVLELETATQVENIPVEIVDTKTISFRTPRCPYPVDNQGTREIPFVIFQSNEEIARVEFVYHSSTCSLLSSSNEPPSSLVLTDQQQTANTDQDMSDELNNNQPLTAVNTPFDDNLFDDIM